MCLRVRTGTDKCITPAEKVNSSLAVGSFKKKNFLCSTITRLIHSFTTTHSRVLLFLHMNKANIPYGKWNYTYDDGPDARN